MEKNMKKLTLFTLICAVGLQTTETQASAALRMIGGRVVPGLRNATITPTASHIVRTFHQTPSALNATDRKTNKTLKKIEADTQASLAKCDELKQNLEKRSLKLNKPISPLALQEIEQTKKAIIANYSKAEREIKNFLIQEIEKNIHVLLLSSEYFASEITDLKNLTTSTSTALELHTAYLVIKKRILFKAFTLPVLNAGLRIIKPVSLSTALISTLYALNNITIAYIG